MKSSQVHPKANSGKTDCRGGNHLRITSACLRILDPFKRPFTHPLHVNALRLLSSPDSVQVSITLFFVDGFRNCVIKAQFVLALRSLHFHYVSSIAQFVL